MPEPKLIPASSNFKPKKPLSRDQVFGRLTVLGQQYRKNSKSFVDVRCNCGTVTSINASRLRCGKTNSCGCFSAERKQQIKARLSHGKKYTKVYRTWGGMHDRCRNPNTRSYKRYGGRGISVCQRWHKFEPFYEDMGDPLPFQSLDRIDPNGNYEPSNCRWTDCKQQARNRTNNRYFSYQGKSLLAVQWSELLGLPKAPFILRLFSLGWTIERAINQPFRRSPKKL